MYPDKLNYYLNIGLKVVDSDYHMNIQYYILLDPKENNYRHLSFDFLSGSYKTIKECEQGAIANINQWKRNLDQSFARADRMLSEIKREKEMLWRQ